MKKTFTEKVLTVVGKIKKGNTMNYGQVARLAGSPRASRAVGSILKKNFNSKIPCHRVVLSSGKAGQYNRGAKNKIKILKKEGVKF